MTITIPLQNALKAVEMYEAENERLRAANHALRAALMWAFDRLGVDGGMTEKEQLHTMREIGKVLAGRHSPAASYRPNEWDSSAKINSRGGAMTTFGDAIGGPSKYNELRTENERLRAKIKKYEDEQCGACRAYRLIDERNALEQSTPKEE